MNGLSSSQKCLVLTVFLLVIASLSGCASGQYRDLMRFPAPLQNEQQEESSGTQALVPEKDQERWGNETSARFSQPPLLPGYQAAMPLEAVDPPVDIVFDGKPVSVNFKDMLLPAFINHIFGDILNITFTLPQAISKRNDLVTLRSQDGITLDELYRLAVEVISHYGIRVSYQDGLLNFTVADSGTEEIPLLVSGRTLPEVPNSHRPIFQLVELTAVRQTMVASWLRVAFDKKEIEIFEDPMRNAILIKGVPDRVALALDMIRVLDQPHMRSRHSLRVEPVYLDSAALASQLTGILTAEGLAVDKKDAPIILLPLIELNALLIFAPDEDTLGHIREWISSLDQPDKMVGEGVSNNGIFSYQVRNTTAESIVVVLEQVLGNLKNEEEQNAAEVAAQKTASAVTGAIPPVEGTKAPKKQTGKEIIVDPVRNTILFQGSGARWNQLLPVIHNMDQTDRMVLLEVIIAEITLDENESLGINWTVTSGDTIFGTGSLKKGDKAGLTLGSTGFSFILDNAGTILARFNAFAEQKKLAILSTPRLMVKNGTEASITVGKEVPFISRAVSSTNVTPDDQTGIVSETQYKKTGILLTVKPTVFSGNRVELEVSQEASETTPDDTNNTASPSIFNRQIKTSLTLKDGSSVLLGGLITTNRSNGWQGVPGISSAPFLGRFFRVDGEKSTKTEMVMMIIPYIVDGDREARTLTRAYLDRLSFKAGGKEYAPQESHK